MGIVVLMSNETAVNAAEKKKTVVQLVKNMTMGFVVTIFESLSLNPLLKLFDGSFLAEKFGLMLVANTVSIVVFFFVRFFVNYFWVFHSKKNIIKIIPLFAVLIAVFSYSTTKMIEGMVYLLKLSEAIFTALGEDNIILISKLVVTFIMGLVNFAVCKWLIFNDDKKAKTQAE